MPTALMLPIIRDFYYKIDLTMPFWSLQFFRTKSEKSFNPSKQ